MNDWQRVTDPMNPPSPDYVVRNEPAPTMHQHLRDAAAHATACKAAIGDAYNAAVLADAGLAVYSLELMLNKAVEMMRTCENAAAAAQTEE